MAFILQQNGSPAGNRELLTDTASLKTMPAPRWPRPMGGGVTRGVSLPPPPPRPNPLDKITPVTDAMLTRPPEGDWLSWRRTYDAYGFSPLKKINRSNVKELRVAWSWALPIGANQTAPLVHDGVHVRLRQRRQGAGLRRRHRRPAVAVRPPAADRRGAQLQAQHLDLRHAALRADLRRAHRRPRREDGERPCGTGRLPIRKGGYGITGGTLVARGKVMVGTTGRAPGGNYIVALDAETGKEAWRVSTIARPASPAATRGTTSRSRRAAADRSGFRAATTRSTTWRSSGPATPTTRCRCATR